VIDLQELVASCGFSKWRICNKPIANGWRQRFTASWRRETHDEEAVAVGSLRFFEKVKSDLGIKALLRELEQSRSDLQAAIMW
jgi:hypothetical protein